VNFNPACFYEDTYEQVDMNHISSRLPTNEEVESLKSGGFVGTESDYTKYIKVLKASGIERGAKVLDFGCSWGYGTFQLREAGFDAVGYEISPRRSQFAQHCLGIPMVSAPEQLGPIDCMFSAHVMEHLPRPQVIWELAKSILKDSGVLVAFMPNGDPIREGTPGYHASWGQIHPLMITSKFLKNCAMHYGFSAAVYSAPTVPPFVPFPDALIRNGTDGNLSVGHELCVVARRSHLVLG